MGQFLRISAARNVRSTVRTLTRESCPLHAKSQTFPELLHSLNAPGLPAALLWLKTGRLVILLCNIDSKRSLCNCTRVIVIHMSNCFLEIQTITGDHAGKMVLIPRMTFI